MARKQNKITTPRYVYVLYKINHYPEHDEHTHNPCGIFLSRKEIKEKIKDLAQKYPVLYGRDYICVEKVKLNNLDVFKLY